MKIIKNYRINENTLAILPIDYKNSVIYEVEKVMVINNTPNNIIKYNCMLDGSSYSLRVNYTRNMIGIMYKSPILVRNDIIFFPTCSPRQKDVAWINLKSINNLYLNNENNKSIIELINGNKLVFKETVWALNNQILKACRFEFLLRKNSA